MNSPERKHRRLNETLLFPSLGSTDFQIPAAIAAGALRTSLSKLDAAYPLGLTFCDDSADASVSILHQPEFASNVDSVLNVHEVSTLGDLGLVLAPRPSILVVECNWRFAPNANRLSAALHRLLGNGSDAPTALLAGTLAGSAQLGAQVGLAYPVAVPSTCILATEYGLRHIIYSRPPNLNPTRPDCISGLGSIVIGVRYQ
jgi:aprataxin